VSTIEIENKNPWFNRFKYVIPLFVIAVVLLVGNGASRLAFSTDYRAFFGKDNPQLKNFEALQNVYGKDDNILFVLEPKEGGLFNAQALESVRELTKESWKMPFSTRVDSITNYQHTESKGDDLFVGDLVKETSGLSENEFVKIKNIALNEPLLVNRLISKDASVTAINVTLEMPGKEVTEVPEAVAYARQMRDAFKEKYPHFNIYLTGLTMLNNAFAEASMKDMGTLNPIMFLLIFALIIFLTRSISGTFAALVIIILSIVSAMGFAGYIGVQLTPVSMTAVTVIMTLAVADCVHIVITFREGINNGMVKIEAITRSIKYNGLPVFITSLTTAVGFLSLNFSDAPPYHDYGNITAFGVMMAFLLSVSLLPAILSIFPAKAKVQTEKNSRWVDQLANMVIGSKKIIFRIAIAIFIFLGIGFTNIVLNDQFVNYFDKSIEFRKDTDYVMEKLTGIYTMSFPLQSKLKGGIANPKYIKALEKFTDWLNEQPEVIHVVTLSDTFKRLNKNMHGDDPAYHKVPEDTKLAAQYLLLYTFSLPPGLDLENTISNDGAATKLTATLENTTSEDMRRLEIKANKWIEDHLGEVLSGKATSPAVMFSHISKRNIQSMITGTILSTFFITIVMIFCLKSFKYGMLSLIPNLIPVLLTFGFWGYLVSKVDMGVATIAGLTLGIVVDDTVHFMIKYLRARREQNKSPEESVRYAFHTVGKALIITSTVLVVGFLVMSTSSFSMNQSLGLMSAITIMFALTTDLLFLPALLLVIEKNQVRNSDHSISNDREAESSNNLKTQLT